MLKTIDGFSFVRLLENGVTNLVKNKKALNDLNVFPVPDGDTGTNMVMTLRYAYDSIGEPTESASEVALRFATAAVFGARGNSGVITSQFFKGLAQGFKNQATVDMKGFAKALESGYEYAYRSVVKPVEGTMLTVLRDGAKAVKKARFESIDELIRVYLTEAKASLQRTPDLLPILKKAGVVDSGGSGIVCFFEGALAYLNGEELVAEEEIAVSERVDLTKFNKDTKFSYGYCIEGLLQLLTDDFDQDDLKDELSTLGNSIVMTLEGDKLKLHIHSKRLGEVIEECQQYGEFLTIKVENMTVQNMNKAQPVKAEKQAEKARKFLYAEEKTEFDFAVVAAVPNAYLQNKFFEMGADVVIMSDVAPSAQDFLDAFEYAKAKEILVFPNSSNSILTSMHAGSLYKNGRVTVLNSRSVEECYVSLGLIEFEDGAHKAVDVVNEAISNLCQVFIYHSLKDIQYGKRQVKSNEFFSLYDKNILETGDSVEAVALKTIERVVKQKESNVLTIFYGSEMAEQFMETLAQTIGEQYPLLEISLVPTKETACDIVLAFE